MKAANRQITLHSGCGPEETIRKLEITLQAIGITLFAHVDYTAVAREAGLLQRRTELLIFGSATVTMTLVPAIQTGDIRLPLQMLIWQDEFGETWLMYKDSPSLTLRRGQQSELHQRVAAITGKRLRKQSSENFAAR